MYVGRSGGVVAVRACSSRQSIKQADNQVRDRILNRWFVDDGRKKEPKTGADR